MPARSRLCTPSSPSSAAASPGLGQGRWVRKLRLQILCSTSTLSLITPFWEGGGVQLPTCSATSAVARSSWGVGGEGCQNPEGVPGRGLSVSGKGRQLSECKG